MSVGSQHWQVGVLAFLLQLGLFAGPARVLADDTPQPPSPPIISCVGGENATTIARCGRGWLEQINGYRVLHLKGSPYEMGYQHGALLRDSVRKNLDTLLRIKGDETLVEFAGLKVK